MVKFDWFIQRVAAAALVAVAGPVAAQEDVGSFRDRLVQLESEVEILQKEFNVEQIRFAQAQWRKAMEEQETGGMPSVLAVVKLGEQWQARLLYDSGATRALVVGDLIAPGVKISDISFASVTAERLSDGSRSKGGKPRAERRFFALKLAPGYLAASPSPGGVAGQPSPQAPGAGMASPSLSTPLPPPVPTPVGMAAPLGASQGR